MSEDPELNLLLNGLLEGSLTAAETQRVRALLRDSPEARRDYYDLVAVELLLAEQYEMPDHIAMQAQLMGRPEQAGSLPGRSSGRVVPMYRRQRTFAWAGGGIAAMAALSWVTFSFVGSRQSDVSVVVSPDSHYEVNGVAVSSGVLKAGDLIEVKHGVVSLALTKHVDATLEGPVTLRLGDRQGRVELISGSAFFDISPGGAGFEVHSPAGIIRDIGTKFGVSVLESGEVETHVDEGRVEVERQDGPKLAVTAGYSASWGKSGPVVSRKTSEDSYVRFLPNETPLLVDNFADPDGTALDGKAPKIGQKWKADFEVETTVIRNGRFDTSGSPRQFTAAFEPQKEDGSVYILTFRSHPPDHLGDKKDQHDAEESISLKDEKGVPLVSLVARADRKHHWQLKDEATGRLSIGTRLSVFDDHTLTLSYDRRRGVVSLFDGPSPQGTIIDDLTLDGGPVPSAISISNTLGGDVSVDDIVVRMVTYQR
ncbi:MAG: Fe2+-dicitrate sensor, rane component [Akkermansiaceae bacterium]|nr:Fe2+-dicitrate sensor, rane component [Akkermansiaceae bacterium]